MRFVLTLATLLPFAYAQPSVKVDNEHARVLVVTDPPHKPGAMHEHKMNRVMIYLDAGTDRLNYESGRVAEINFKPGDVLWSPISGPHKSENTGEKPFRVVEVELKNEGKEFKPSALDPVKVAPANYKVLLDNAQVRVLRARIDAGGSVPLHEHALDRVTVYLTPFRLRVTPEGGKPIESTGAAYEIRAAAPQRHAEQNLSDAPFEVITVELK